MIPWREFEATGVDERKAYVQIIKNIKHTYTGETFRYVRVDYSNGEMEFVLLNEEEYEELLEMRNQYPVTSPGRISQKDWEEFWD